MLYICKLRNQLDLNQAIRVSHKIIALQKTFPEFVPIFSFLFIGRFNKTFLQCCNKLACLSLSLSFEGNTVGLCYKTF